jgi:hypothetical protein
MENVNHGSLKQDAMRHVDIRFTKLLDTRDKLRLRDIADSSPMPVTSSQL